MTVTRDVVRKMWATQTDRQTGGKKRIIDSRQTACLEAKSEVPAPTALPGPHPEAPHIPATAVISESSRAQQTLRIRGGHIL